MLPLVYRRPTSRERVKRKTLATAPAEPVIVRTMSSEVVLGAGGVTVTVVPLTTAVKGAIDRYRPIRAFRPEVDDRNRDILVTASAF